LARGRWRVLKLAHGGLDGDKDPPNARRHVRLSYELRVTSKTQLDGTRVAV